MGAYKSAGQWRYRKQWTDKASGRLIKISGTPVINTKQAAEIAERKAIEDALNPQAKPQAMTFGEFWADSYVPNWCGAENKPGTVREKLSIYEHHLKETVGPLNLHEITTEFIQKLKAKLKTRTNRYGEPISSKTADNVLTVLGHAIKYANEIDLVEKMPKIRLYNAPRAEPEPFTILEWSKLLKAAKDKSPTAHIACLLGADAGLRVGEIYPLEWDDINFDSMRLRIKAQQRKGVVGTTKSDRIRYVPLTDTLVEALRALPWVPRTGPVVRGPDGLPVSETYIKHVIYKLCKTAGVPDRGWHALRHSYGTHLAMFGVSPWALQAWMGHSSVTQTEQYVTLANNRSESIPDSVIGAGQAQQDPDRRVLAMLAARTRLGSESGRSEVGFATDLQNNQARTKTPSNSNGLEVGGTGIEPATRAV